MQTQINTIEQAMLSIQQMPVNAQQQIFNYISEMQYKHQAKDIDSQESDIEKSFGILKEKKSFSTSNNNQLDNTTDAGKFNAVFGMLKSEDVDITASASNTGNFAKFAGILKSDKQVTIEEMNDVIKRRGAGLDCD